VKEESILGSTEEELRKELQIKEPSFFGTILSIAVWSLIFSYKRFVRILNRFSRAWISFWN